MAAVSGEMTKDFGEVDVKKGSFDNEDEVICFDTRNWLVSCQVRLRLARGRNECSHWKRSIAVTPVEDSASPNVQTDPGVLANDPKQASQDFDSILIAITESSLARLLLLPTLLNVANYHRSGREISAQQ